MISKSKCSNTINVNEITRDLQIDINNKMKSVTKRTCEETDIEIGINKDITQVCENKCDGEKQMKDELQEMNSIIPIIASYSEQNKTILSVVPTELMCKTKKYKLVGHHQK